MKLDTDSRIALLKVMKKEIDEELDIALAEKRQDLQYLQSINPKVNKLDLEINGATVGSISKTTYKAKPYIKKERIEEAFNWLYEEGLVEDLKLKRGWENNFDIINEETVLATDSGEIIEWLGVNPQHDGTPTVKLVPKMNFQKVYELLKPQLKDENVFALLGGE